MRLLLDTHIAIWAATDEAELSEGERSALARADGLIVSAVSVWETRLKWNSRYPSGLRKGIIAPETLLAFVEAMGWGLLPLSARHAAATLNQAISHRDPFDELLLVQAQEESLRLLTRDANMLDHPVAFTV